MERKQNLVYALSNYPMVLLPVTLSDR